jgi:hypothetical protein
LRERIFVVAISPRFDLSSPALLMTTQGLRAGVGFAGVIAARYERDRVRAGMPAASACSSGALCGLLGVRDLLIPGVPGDPELLLEAMSQRTTGRALTGKDPAGDGSLTAENTAAEVLNGFVGSAEFAQEAGALVPCVLPLRMPSSSGHVDGKLVSLRHGVKEALFRIDDVPRKISDLKRPEIPPLVGKRLKQECKAKGVTRDWLAAKTGAQATSISRFYSTGRGISSDGLASVLAAAAEREVDVEYVFTGKRNAAGQKLLELLGDPDVTAAARAVVAKKATKNKTG